jgi:pyruvate carboxylase subunit B
VSQFYFQQAFNNVMIGPWKKIAEGYGKMVLGYFGKTPVEPDPEIVKLSQEQIGLEPTTKKVVDINDEDETKGIEAAKKMLERDNLPITDENIFIAATCKEKGITFLKGEARTNVRKVDRTAEKEEAAAGSGGEKAAGASAYTVTVGNNTYTVSFEGGKAVVNGTAYDVDVQAAEAQAGAGQAAAGGASGGTGASGTGEKHKVEAPMPGLILRIEKNVGDTVQEGDLIMVMEAMKMETEIHSPASGTIREIAVKQGDQLKAGELLAVIS